MLNMHGDTSISLLKAIRNGDTGLARRILLARSFTDIDKQTTRKDGTALFWACCLGYMDLVHLLLLHGADVNACTSWGATPLHACVDHNYAEIATLLIRFGANVNQQTNYGDTPCHLASYRGFLQCVKRLAEEDCDVTLRNNKRLTPLEEAYVNGHSNIYKYLVAVQQIVKSQHPKREEPSQTTQFPVFTNTTEATSLKLHPAPNAVPNSLYSVQTNICSPPQWYLPHPAASPQCSVQSETRSVRSEMDGSFSDQESVDSSIDFRNISEIKESNVPVPRDQRLVLRLNIKGSCTNDLSTDFSGLSMNDLSSSPLSTSSSSSDFSSSSLSSVHKMSFKNI